MAFMERQEYFFLIRMAQWTPETVARLNILREWKDSQEIPHELRSKPITQCVDCRETAPPYWFFECCQICAATRQGGV